MGASRMTQWVKALAAEPGDPHSGRREQPAAGYPLTCTYEPQYFSAHILVQMSNATFARISMQV